jgi:ferredoxin-fold anticodon binding domain-containing protein
MNKELSKADNYAMLKYIYKTRFHLGTIEDVQDMDDFYGKLGPLINWRKLTKTNPLEPEITKYLKHIDYQTTESMRKLIDVLGYEIKNRLIDSKRIKTNWMSEVKDETMFMLNQKEVMLQLGSTNFVSDRTFHKTLEAYLGQYGYKLTIGERKDRSSCGVRFKDYPYQITEINAIGHLLDSVSKQQLENMECQID